MDSSSLQDSLSARIAALAQQEEAMEAEAKEVENRLSGLKDLDLLLNLARVKFLLCLALMERMTSVENTEAEAVRGRISAVALSAFGIVEGLVTQNVSEDQRGVVTEDPAFAPLKDVLEEFLLKGGGGFLEAEQLDADRRRVLARGIVSSIRKYSTEDDRYPPLELENYPAFVRRILLTFFPVFVKENPEKPPYGIEEGQETTYSSQKMKLPLSQAIFYMEEELLPELAKELEQSPGDGAIQEQIESVTQRVEEYKKMRFFPRSVPVLLEPGFFTQGMTGYSADGEMLVPIPVPVTFRSGTNLDRKMELVRADLVRRLAGKGICAELDREYERLKSLDSGLQGSSRTPGFKINVSWGFRALKQEFPALGRLEDKEGFKQLSELALRRGRIGASTRRVEALLQDRQGIRGAMGIGMTDTHTERT